MVIKTLVSWLQKALGESEQHRPRRRRHAAPAVQQLEVRQLLAATGAPQIDLKPVTPGPGGPQYPEFPESVVRGQSFTLTNAVQNLGTSPSGAYTIRYYLSSDAAINPQSDLLLETVTRTTSIGAGATSQWTQRLTIPSNQAYGSYYLGMVVDPTNAIAETNESNNIRATSTPIRVTSAVELRPWEVTAPASAVRGSTFDVWAKASVGSSVYGLLVDTTYTVSYYLSSDSNITTSDLHLKTITKTLKNSATVSGGNTVWVESITLPANLTPGNYYIGVFLDAGNVHAEKNESDNGWASTTPIAISAPPQIDLAATMVDAPASAYHSHSYDSPINVSMQVRNNGSSASGDFYVEYYLSTDSTITRSDVLLGSGWRSSIAAGGVQNWVQSLTTPSNLPTGNYYIGMLIDPPMAARNIAETNEANNTAADAIQLKAWTDLKALSTFSSPWVFPGESADISANFNVDGFHPTGPFAINYYLSTDRNITTTDILLKTVTHPGVNGGTMWFATERVAIPANLAAGNYYVGVMVDPLNAMVETIETNNAVASEKVTVVSRRPDLEAYSVDFANAPMTTQTANAGATVNLWAQAGNASPFGTGPYTVGFYISRDNTITTADTLLKTVTRPGFTGRQPDRWNESVVIPASLAAGNYYIGMIVDPFNTIVEANDATHEVLNASQFNASLIVTRPTTIDLDPYLVDGPTTAARGSDISVRTGVSNLGTSFSGIVNVAYYLSTDRNINTQDIPLRSFTQVSLDGGASKEWTETVGLSSTIIPGQYYLGAIVDFLNVAVESDESNNTETDAQPITITAPAQIDLELTNVDAPATAVRGATISVATNVANRGTSPSGAYKVAYYISTDATINSTTDTALGTFDGVPVTARDSSFWNQLVALPSTLAAGNYYIGAIVDSANAIAETNESNNAKADATPISITAPKRIDLDPLVVDGPTAAVRGTLINVSTTMDNLAADASGAYTVNYYLSTDATINKDDLKVGGATNLPSIAGRGSVPLNHAINLPSTLITGTYYLGVIVDPDNQIVETTESNNWQADAQAIVISAASKPGFNIELNMYGDWTVAQRAIFEQAAQRWEQVITSELTDVPYKGQIIDDLLIDATSKFIDGEGTIENGVRRNILGQAGPDQVRTISGLPAYGTMEFDSVDMAEMEAEGSLLAVITHEMGHVLGIGTLWEDKGLLVGKGSAAPTYIGARALAEYKAIFGSTATAVPVQGSDMGKGSQDSHWRESVLVNELMTPSKEAPGVPMPISRVTIASLADLGYTVNMNAADPYSKPAGSTGALQGNLSTQSRPATLVQVNSGNGTTADSTLVAFRGTPCTCGMCVSLVAAAPAPATYPSLTPAASAGSQNTLAFDPQRPANLVSGNSRVVIAQGRTNVAASSHSDFWGLSCDDVGSSQNRPANATTPAAGAGLTLQQLFGQLRSEDLWAMPV